LERNGIPEEEEEWFEQFEARLKKPPAGINPSQQECQNTKSKK
jgi:hypothetical protein